MSSDESDVGGRKRKRKPRLPDGPASISSGSPIIGSSSSSCRRQNVLRESSSSDPESGAESDVVVKRKKTVKLDTDSDFSSSESDSSPIFPRRLGIRGHLRNISESEDSDASSIIVPHRFRNTVPLQMSDQEDEEDGTYQWVTDEDSDKEPQSDVTKPSTSILREENAINSDSSDGHSEKCPICLISFRLQEVGVPENCVHTFCLECIEEWSKNMNTCPVDRKEYNSITVRKCLNGKVVRKIPIQRPETQEEPVIIEDPTFCEVCGLSADEDRLLLCDGCDLGFHLYCLEPPLIEVPEGAWYCNNCGPDMNRAIGLDEVVALMDDADDFFGGIPFGFLAHRRTSSRLMPRTRHSERVRHRVERNRSQRRQQQPLDENTPSTSDGRVSSNRVSSTSATPTKKPRKKRKRPNKRSAAKYKTVWVLNEFGEAVPMKRRVKGRRRKIKKKLKKKTVKKRLASQLGVCASQQVGQSLPDVRISSGSSSSLGYQRFQAGIPRLDILGTVNRLDYFSQSEDEGISNENEATGVHTLFARRSSNSSGALRRVTRRKAALVAAPTVSSTTDILDSIMNSQERLLSKNSVLSVVDSSGKLIIEDKTKEPPLNNNSPSKPDFNSYRVKETPWHGRNYNSGYRPHNRNSWSGNRNSWQQQNSGNNYNNYPQRNSSGNLFGQGSSNYFQNRGQSFQNDIPQDYTQRTLCEAELLQGEEKEKPTPDNTSQLNAEAEVDVYGDIENESVSTSRIDEHFKPATPPQAVQSHTPNTNTDEDNDSESGMVIDTERGPDEAVSSTVGIGEMYDPSVPPPAYNLNHPSPTQHTYSPGQPTDSPENPQYSPGEPTYSPEGSDAQCNAAPSFDQVEELKSGFDELQKEFASGLKEFQMSIRSSVEQADDNEEQDISTNYDEQCREVPVSSEVEDAECLEERNNEEAFEENQSLPLEPHNLDDILMPMENAEQETKDHPDDDEVSNDGCPNFSIYSRQSKSVALTTDISLPPDLNEDPITDESSSLSPANQSVTVEKTGSDPRLQKHPSSSLWNLGGLYSDSEDESVVKKTNTFGLSDIKDMTEDILSEEERSYTPVLDERPVEKPKEVFEGLDTELISDDDRNDFDESHEQKTASEGDALEINAKESELEFTRPDDFEEGEIVDKNKEKVAEGDIGGTTPEKKTKKDKDGKRKKKEKEKDKSTDEPSAESIANKENVNNKESFKKLTKSNKERNYRDKDKATERSRSKTPATVSKREESKKKKEKRKELERYNVRAIIAEKPRPPPKDQFGRDIRQSPTRSRSRSYTPPIAEKSPIRARASPSPIRAPSPAVRRRSVSKARTPPRGRSPTIRRRSASRSRDKSGKRKRKSRSKSADKKGDRFRAKKRRRSTSRSNKRKKSKEKGKKRRRSGSRKRHQSRSLSPRRSRREWTPSLSRSLTPPLHHGSPSWTPPRADVLRNQNLTVIVNNEAAKKKKDKRNKDKRRKDDSPQRRRRRDRERTPPPSKEVFASGDNILVSVSFNNENESRDVSTRDSRKRKEASASEQQKRSRERRNKTRKDLSGIKPVAIIDLERSPFQEIESSPKDVIVLSDSDNNENEKRNKEGNACDSSQQVASPEETPNYSMGPKTPPEPSVKFSLLAKPQQVRAINNPLHDPLEAVEEEQQDEMSQNSHKGPNTPPEEPPTSAPSSPDAYDPFEPTKSRSQTPEPRNVDIGEQQEIKTGDRCTTDLEKAGQTPDVIIKSVTPPVADIQPADSQSSVQEISESKSPDDRSAMLASQQTITKPVAQTVPFSPVQSTLAAAVVPVSTTVTISRINILSSAMISPVKPNPVKILPTKAAVKSTPIKPMLSKFTVVKKKQQNGNTLADANLELDSPYSPGSSDYDDLFEPPSEPTASIQTKSKSSKAAKASAGGGKKSSSAFDTLFGSPNFNKKTTKKTAAKKPMPGQSKTKHVGVKVDEDSLKILEDLPNSAVEMQVKDKFLKKLNRQERVVEEVKLVLKPFYNKKKITKEEYKDIMRRAVPKICHNKSGEINPLKIRHLTEAYVKKLKHSKKVTSSSSLPQKVV